MLVWALTRELGLDGFRPPPEQLTAEYVTACEASLPLACEVSSGSIGRSAQGVLDLTQLRARAGEWCAHDDAVACLLDGMLRVREPFGGFRPDTPPPDQRVARTAFMTACETGLSRGCTELAMTYVEGTWSYRSPLMARSSFQQACDGGDPEGCRQLGRRMGPLDAAKRSTLLNRASAMGHTEADTDLARLDDDPVAMAKACDRGSARACLAIDDPARACAIGDSDACITELLERAEREPEPDRPALVEALTAWCDTVDRACREAEFLRDGSPIIAHEPGRYSSPDRVPRALLKATGNLGACHRGALRANRSASGSLDVWMRIDAEGRVVGVFVPNAFDPGLAACTEQMLQGMSFGVPLLGTMSTQVSIPFEATTRIEVPGSRLSRELRILQDEANARADAVGRCVLDHDDIRYVQTGGFSALVQRNHPMTDVRWTSADWTDETRDCLLAVFTEPFQSAPPVARRVDVELHFFEERPIPLTKFVPEPLPPITPDHVQLLALVSGEVEAGVAARVARVHQEVAAMVSGFTRGGLVVDTEVRVVPAGVFGATIAKEEVPRLRFEAFEVPEALWSRVPAGRYDGIVLWLPVPEGGSVEPDLGTTTAGTLRGASFSALPVPTGPEAVEGLLDGLWSQLRMRAKGQLGVELPEASAGVSYDHLFRYELHPALRADLRRLDVRERAAPDDVALLGLPLRDGGAHNVEVLLDSRRSFDPPGGKDVFEDGSTLGSDREEPGWWGVVWPSPVQVATIRAQLGDPPSAGASVRSVEFEGRVGSAWKSLGTVVPNSAAATLTLPTAAVFDAVRVRVLAVEEGALPVCNELEVYGPRP